jgi:hypothetical protein
VVTQRQRSQRLRKSGGVRLPVSVSHVTLMATLRSVFTGVRIQCQALFEVGHVIGELSRLLKARIPRRRVSSSSRVHRLPSVTAATINTPTLLAITTHNHTPPLTTYTPKPTPSHTPTHHDNLSRLQTPLPRIQTPHPRPTGRHHRGPRRRRRPLRLGSADRRTRRHTLRRRHLPRRTKVPERLPSDASHHEVFV